MLAVSKAYVDVPARECEGRTLKTASGERDLVVGVVLRAGSGDGCANASGSAEFFGTGGQVQGVQQNRAVVVRKHSGEAHHVHGVGGSIDDGSARNAEFGSDSLDVKGGNGIDASGKKTDMPERCSSRAAGVECVNTVVFGGDEDDIVRSACNLHL